MKKYLLPLLLLIGITGMAQNGTVLAQRKIADSTANFTGVLAAGVNFGSGVAAIGDLNGNGITELMVGAYDVGGKGAVYTLFMNASGGVDSFKTITQNVGGFTGVLDADDRFGYSVALIGDLDLDGVPDVAVSSELDDDGGSDRGAVWILYLKADGTVKSHAKISSATQGSLLATPSYGLGDLDRFGSEVAGIGDLDGDGIPDIAVSAIFDDDGGNNRGAVWIIFLNRNGSIKGFQKISDTQGGFTGTMQNGGFWGSGLASIGDLDGDGVQDLAVGQELANANGTYKGALWILFMNTNGTVKSYRELRNGLTGTGLPTIGDNSMFGSACAALGDIDGDGIPDLAVGANGSDGWRGGVYILMMNADGTVKAHQKIGHNNAGGFAGPLDANDLFGSCIANLGDINGDGKTDIAVGSTFDDDGGGDKGAVYILNLQGVVPTCTNSASGRSVSICQGDSYFAGGANQTVGGTYRDTITTVGGCDSVVTTTLSIKPTASSTLSQTICFGDSYLGHTTQGTHRDTFTAANGCDSIRVLNLTVRPQNVTNLTQTICFGDSYLGHTTTGIHRDTFAAANGCDSIRTVNLTVRPQNVTNLTQTICFGDNYLGHTATGIHRDTFTAANGCDSIRTVNLTVRPQNVTNLTQTICFGDSYLGHTATGIHRDTFAAANGCDSIRVVNLTVRPQNVTNLTQTICQGQSVEGYTATGIYHDTLAGANSCDSIRILNLTVVNTITTGESKVVCFGESYLGHSQSGSYSDTSASVGGCDSVHTLTLTILPQNTTTLNHAICDGESYQGHTTGGTYTDTLTAASGCDSIVSIVLTVNPTPAVPTIQQNGNVLAIDSAGDIQIVWFLGVDNILGATNALHTATQNGVYYVVVSNSFGCAAVSDTVQVTGVGVEEAATLRLSVYPNPTTGQLTLEMDGPAAQWALYNQLGQLLMQGHALALTTINLQDYSEGVYYLKVQTAEGVATQKVLLVE